MQNSKLISTIIPVHNRPGMVREAVRSVVAQDYRPIEVIIVDDGSSDDTVLALAELAALHPETRVIRRENGGPGAARETGRCAARGEFIQYLDSDDLLLPGKFSLQTAALLENGDCGVSYGMTRFRNANGEIVEGAWKGSGVTVETMFPAFLVSRWWDTPNPLYRRDVCDRVGPWLATRVEEDWEYDCRIASQGVRLAYVPTYVCEVRDHPFERLSRSGGEPMRLRDRAIAHARIFQHARNAGIEQGSEEMQHFARALFLLARQCGARGLKEESQRLFELSQRASVQARANGWDFKLYRAATELIGWRWTGRLTCELDKLRR